MSEERAKEKKLTDLSDLDYGQKAIEAGVEFNLKHPGTGEETDIVFTVRSFESEECKKYDKSLAAKHLHKQKRNKTLSVGELEEFDDRKTKMAVVGWENLELDGVLLDFNKKNVDIVFKRFPWVAEQVIEVAGDRSAFFLKSQKISAMQSDEKSNSQPQTPTASPKDNP